MYTTAKAVEFDYSTITFKHDDSKNQEKLKKQGFYLNGRLGEKWTYMRPAYAIITLEAVAGGETISANFDIIKDIKKYFGTTEEITEIQFKKFYQDIQKGKIKFEIQVNPDEYKINF